MPPTPFSEALTKYRELAGLTQLQLAKRSGTAHSSVNRWEKGGSLPKRDNVERLDAALNAGKNLLAAWRTTTTGHALPEWARDLASIERSAKHLTLVTPAPVPGLLQCPELARAVFRAGQPVISTEEIDQLVTLRTERLKDLSDLRVVAVFPALSVTRLPDSLRRAQVRHLLEWSETGRVAVHLVPEETAPLVPVASLMLYRLRGGELAVVSDHADGNVIHDEHAHDRLTGQVTAALADSLPELLSLDLLRKLT